MNKAETEVKISKFSLVAGGPVYRFWKRVRMSGTDMEFVGRRILLLVGITWLPLFLLSLYEGTLFKGETGIPFFLDAAIQARFLVALPVLLFAELIAHRRVGPRIREFLERRIITGDEISKFQSTIDRAHRMRDSSWLELGLLVLVYTVGVWSWYSQMVVTAPSWFAIPDGTRLNLTTAGYWFAFVSVPIFQFIVLRWYARFLIWLWFLWRVSRMSLDLIPTHPDRAGGIGFLSRAAYPFGFVLFTHGVLLSGLIANLILHDGHGLMEFKIRVVGYIVFLVALMLSPLAVFIPALVEAKRRGLGSYDMLATRYTRAFGKKWTQGADPATEELLGSGDIQSLADLGNSYSVIREMNIGPFGLRDMMFFAAFTAAPLLPLSLFIFSLDELLDQLLKVLI